MSEAPAILAEGLVKTYGKTTALAGLDLTVPAGTVYGLLGPNGAGKTTAVRVFSTLLRPNRPGQSRPGDGQKKLARSYTVLLWYTVPERTTYE